MDDNYADDLTGSARLISTFLEEIEVSQRALCQLYEIAKALQRIAYAMECERGASAEPRPCCGAYVSTRAAERSCPVCGKRKRNGP